ncbi:unnamed protein product [Ranitomeya imitator]|uniref:Reverse transcriptase domain-containing protein n=1 Tax=Ranitomeya imitator TaxID=111125 RepID=A0ABN9LNL2_9NEOB|nr:unnamed protein product [Ranitomeya imitator]
MRYATFAPNRSSTFRHNRPISLDSTFEIVGFRKTRLDPKKVKDKTDLLNKLAAIGPLQEGTILATMDMESLYSNIPHQNGLNACKVFIENTGTDTDSVVKLIKFILTHNYFEFDSKIYLQETGTAMGSKMAPQYANLFMAKLESDFLFSRPIRPLAYYRYIDVILII